MADNKLVGEVSQEQIDKWKADKRNNGVHGIIVGGHIGYVKTPDRNVVSYALSKMSFKMSMAESQGDDSGIEMNMGDLYKKGEAVIINCWLGGSDEIQTNTQLYIGACIAAGNLVEYEAGELKKF